VPVVRLVKIGEPVLARKLGAWSALPQPDADWDAPETNRAIADALTGGEPL
jgi:hypothetical protein